MGGEVDPTVSTVESPPDFNPLGSPEGEVHAPPSDEDKENDHDEDPDPDHDHDPDLDPGHEHPSGTTAQTEDLKHKIIKQAEYYFSDENLPTDKYMMGLMKKNKEGFVPITIIASFRKMKKLTRDYSFIVAALRESSFLVVNSDGKKVKRLHPFPFTEYKNPNFCTVLVENLPEDHSAENLQIVFGEAGKIKNISIRDPHAAKESKKGSKVDNLLSNKLHAIVEYETVEAAEKAFLVIESGCNFKKRTGLEKWSSMGKEDEPGRNLIQRRIATVMHAIKQEMRRSILQVSFKMIPLMKRMGSMYPGKKVVCKAEIECDQERADIVLPMEWAMEHPLHMPLNPQNHNLGQKCLMEPGDSLWVEADLPCLIKVCKPLMALLCDIIVFCHE